MYAMYYINDIIARIGERLRLIKQLIVDKFEIYGKIQSIMDDKAVVCMTHIQIEEYRRFTNIYDSEIKLVKKWLAELDGDMKLIAVKQEIVKEDTDYGLIYDNLRKIDDKQRIVISELEKIIAVGNSALAVL